MCIPLYTMKTSKVYYLILRMTINYSAYHSVLNGFYC